MSTLDTIRTWNDRHPAGTGAHVREVARDNGAMLRRAMADNTTPAAAGQPTREAVTRTATRRAPVQSTDCPAGNMFIPGDLSYAMVDAMLMQLKPCLYALRKADGTVSFFEISEYRGAHRIQMLAGSPGGYQHYPMKLKMQYMAARHLLDDPDGAIALYGAEANECARCRSLGRHSPLTDATSRAIGLGPICRGYWA
jgi:hypothetical protein